MNVKSFYLKAIQKLGWAFLLMVLAIFEVKSANFALHTSLNTFFRTTQLSQNLDGPDGTFTIELWFKESGAGVLINEVDQFNILVWDRSFLEVDGAGNIFMALPGLTGATTVGKVDLGVWNHVALRYDRSAETLNAFVNGVKSANVLAGIRQFAPGTCFIAFGRSAGTPINVGGWFDGDFDEIRLWNRARTDAEISSSWKARLSPPQEGLVTEWHMDEGTGSNILDSSSGNDTGLIVDAQWVASDLALIGLPTITAVTGIGSMDGSANLSAKINPNDLAAGVFFEYGLTTNYGSRVGTTNLVAQNLEVSVLATLTNLAIGIYHFRVVATNEGGIAFSPDQTFAITNLSGLAASLNTVSNYFRSSKLTRPYFTNSSITVEFWFKATSPGVLLNEVDSLNVTKWDYSWLEILPDGRLVAGIPNVPTINGGTIQLGEWYHVALRYDAATHDLDLFLDGVKVGTSRGTRTVPWDNSSTVYFAMGRGGPDNLGGGAFFKGLIDEVRIWRIPLPDSEIEASIDLIAPPNVPNLFANWSFDSIANDLSPDRSANANPAFFVNGSQLAISELNLSLDFRPFATIGTITDSIGTTVTISGSVVSLDTNTVAYFVWGEGGLTNKTPDVLITGATNTPVQFQLTGLESGKPYQFSLIASNAHGIAQTQPVNFIKLGQAGYSLSIGTNTYIRSTGDQRPFFPDETITAEIWIKPTKAGVVMSETDRFNTNSFDRSLIEIAANGDVLAGFFGVPTITIGNVPFNAWSSIVIRYSKTDLKLSGFVNGVKSPTTSDGDRTAGWEVGSSIIYTFGKATLTKIATGESLPAEWDEIRLWNIARTDAQILATYNARLYGNESGLAAYYRFDERVTPIPDSSGRSNRASITGTNQSFITSSAPVAVRVSPIRIAVNGTITLQFVGTPGRQYRAEGTSDFATWTAGPTVTADALGIITFNVGNFADFPHRFFRMRHL